jgi:hypothetical protein
VVERIGPELEGPVGKADYEKIIAEEAAAKHNDKTSRPLIPHFGRWHGAS